MVYVMMYDTWKERTKLTMKPRSSKLKAIDAAIRKYHEVPTEQSLKDLRLAVHNWKMYKGYDAIAGKPAWLTSERNYRGAVSTLDLQLYGIEKPFESSVLADLAELPYYGIEAFAGDEYGKEVLREARLQALPLLFMGKKVQTKRNALLKAGIELKKGLRKTKAQAKAAQDAATAELKKQAMAPAKAAINEATAPAREAVHDITRTPREIAEGIINEVTQIFPDVANELMDLLTDIIPDFVAELAGAVAPYVSLVPGTRKAVQNTVQTCLAEYKWVKASGHKEAFGAGDPAAAAAAIIRMIERKRNKHARLAAIYTTDVTVKAAAITADAASFGVPTVSAVATPLMGFATAVANLGLKIFLLARDLYEMKQANKILRSPSSIAISVDLIHTCPLLGCYFIACSNHSDIINFLIEDMGAPGWQDDVEVLMKNHVHPMIGYARGAISSSRLEVDGLQMSKGVVTDVSPGIANLKNRLKKQAMDKLKKVVPVDELETARLAHKLAS